MPLNDTTLRNTRPKDKPQKLSDGGGLYLHIMPSGGKHWRMAYRFGGKQKVLAFGPYPLLSLREAREKREEAKKKLLEGIDPMEEKKEIKAAAEAVAKEEQETFEFVAREWFATYSPRLSPKHADKLIKSFLEKKLFPVIGHIQVTKIEPFDLLGAVRKEESKGHIETAHKLMQVCGQVMRYARITGRVKYDVASGLTEAMQKTKVKHFAAITDPKEIGRLLRDIHDYGGHFAIGYCLKIMPYVFTRPSELRLAMWKEFDFDNAVWKIPGSRMKMRREHVVPLSRQVLAMFQELRRYSGDGEFCFPSIQARTTVISDMGPLNALRRMGYDKDEMTLHGFRAMASTCLNELGFRADVIETQLAHKEPDVVRLAYNRAQYMEERRKMMQSWSDYLDELRENK